MMFPRKRESEPVMATREVPPIDLHVPEGLSTATFGVG